ncbi:MAG: LLM class flavin-dependent oxidoreductase [Flavobacterium sp.]|nr:LLM class flavin-dependent oxidoreductase [Flavobacterium sp.]
MKYGILDFGTISPNSNAISTIHETIELVQLAESLGFTRYWLSEHHDEGVAWKSPDIILPLLAGYTDKIKVGAAGVLVGLNAPINTAYHYKLLANLYPSRIDLGLAKGTAESHKCAELTDGADWQKNFKDYNSRVKKIKTLMNDEVDNIILPPCKGVAPDIWILSTSSSSIDFVIEENFNFSLSLLHTFDYQPSPNIIKELKQKYFNKNKFEPQINIAVSAFCSNDKKRIDEIKIKTKNVKLNYAGSPDAFLDFIQELAKSYEVDEVIILNLGETIIEKQNLMHALKSEVSTQQVYY